MLPFFWMILTSFKSQTDMMTTKIWPSAFHPENYPKALTLLPFFSYLKNTMFLVVVNVIGAVTTSSLVAYAFARINWKGRDAWFVCVLATMMLPSQVTQIPLFIVYKRLGWLNTYTPLTIGSYLGGGAFNIFLLRQFFKTLPEELSEAAKIDGCTEIGIFSRIILPLCKPALATIALFTFMGTWNDFYGPLIYLTQPEKFTIALGLRAFQGYNSTQYNYLMAASVVCTIPTLTLFFCFQNYFIEGITLTGIKG
jgi:ABC-type glycerol-3-phosphate transport system permease component